MESIEVSKQLLSTGSVILNLPGAGGVGFQITGIWAGTIVFEGSIDYLFAASPTWAAISLFPPNSATAQSSTTANGIFIGSAAGLVAVRARTSVFTSGALVIYIRSSEAAPTGVAAGGGGGGGSVTQGTIPWDVLDDNSAASLVQETAIAAVAGTTAGAAVITDANGTIQQYLRGLVKLLITAGSALVRTFREPLSANVWTVIHVPATNIKATITQASAGGALRNVCTGFTVTINSDATAPVAINLVVSLIDGVSGGTTYLFRSNISLPAVAGAQVTITRSGLWLPGTAATAMTLEFSAAGGVDTYESVSMEGCTTTL